MARRRPTQKKLPTAPVRASVEFLAHDGRGAAHVDGKIVFIDQALAGEEVEFVYTDIRRDYAEGRLVELITRSDLRIEAECPHYSVCGGCSFQHVGSADQIKIKEELLAEQFRRIGKLDIPNIWPPLDGPHWGYRRKARMGVKYVAPKGRVLVGFRERRQQYLADIESCPVMHPSVGKRLLDLSELLGGLSVRDKIPQIEVAIGDDDCVLAVRVLEPPTAADKERMRAFAREHGISLCLQSKGPDTIAPIEGEAEVIPTYALPNHEVVFRFRPAMFTQVNYEINAQMVDRVIETLALDRNDRVLDLFCGLGNFTLPMARYAGHVVGVEGDLPLVEHARSNARLNGIGNVEFHAADLSRDIDDQPWAQAHYDKILLDPSRAGASEIIRHFNRWRPARIVYVSCNPSTLARDAGILVNDLGYKLVKAGVMNMFPQTAHVESIALFEA
ncbi:MAG: 23S rRNA (uracil(1939)-C(5))-methyltransferase RlmD [Gammaproteobacteria bacterium]